MLAQGSSDPMSLSSAPHLPPPTPLQTLVNTLRGKRPRCLSALFHSSTPPKKLHSLTSGMKTNSPCDKSSRFVVSLPRRCLPNGPNSHGARFRRKKRARERKKGVTLDCCPAETGCVTAPELIKLEWLEPRKVALRNCGCVLTRLRKDTGRRRSAASCELPNFFISLHHFFFKLRLLCYSLYI